MSLRIIGGNLRRRHLRTPQGIVTRPYTDRVRQVVFDRIGDVVVDARVADVFAGVGTMGLEAISRGARSCVFIDNHPQVCRILRENVSVLSDGTATICWKTDARYTSFAPRGAEGMLPYTLVFFDPPYAQAAAIQSEGSLFGALGRLARPSVTDDDVLLLVRTPERFELPELPGWHGRDCWHLSTMKIWTLRKSGDLSSEDADERSP